MREAAREELGYRLRSLRGYARKGLFRYFFRNLWEIVSCWYPRRFWCVEYDGRWCAFGCIEDATREVEEFHSDGCNFPLKGGRAEPDCAPIPPGRLCGSMQIQVKRMSLLTLWGYGEFDGW